MLHVQWGGEELGLLAERALWWRRRSSLLIADPHFGKPAAFRQAGIPVPAGTTRADLHRLSRLLDRTGARRLVVLGDFFHAPAGRSDGVLAAIGSWRRLHCDLEIVLVRGNHDLHAGDPPPAWNLLACDGPRPDPPLLLAHEPEPQAGGLVLGGHLHPAVVLEGAGAACLRLPCFILGRRRGILPAFGGFTGCRTLRPARGDRVFAVAGDEVIETAVKDSSPGCAR